MKMLIIGTSAWNTIIYVDKFIENAGTIFASKYKEVIGGTAAGKAFNFKRLGFDTRLVTKISEDESGKRIKEKILVEKIEGFYIIDEISTERHTNLMDKKGDRISIYTHYGKSGQDYDIKSVCQLMDEADLIFLDICDFVKKLFPILPKYKDKIVLDIHNYDGKNPWHQEFLPYANYIFMSSDALNSEKEVTDLMNKLIENRSFVVCTHGKKGAEILTKERKTYFQESILVEDIVDSNGAGDSFVAGFFYAYSKGLSEIQCMKYASLVAKYTIESEELYSPNLTPEKLETDYEKYFR
ncbi:carbohydrate kinase family protein [Caviibacterium pharyngocola]|uniref:Carbohydrate kinase family protein n=1 Tax=Caviibacterium pharyngocola TaxID=28159 RepID=A0A2M8RXB2_9PAST|nr:carbohydrate kinase family protein [Caviibacterium pharyngocola]PJG83529.1 carbohydrate kinase family protein [Caviibacterium pharyngocola]